MEHSNKVEVRPIQSKNKHQPKKLLRQIKIILSLAKIHAYDSDGRIKGENGYIPNSDIVHLLTHAMSSGRVLVGEQEFIRLLHQANIDPELILNDDVRAKLKQYVPKANNETIEPQVSEETENTGMPVDQTHGNVTERKRRRSDSPPILEPASEQVFYSRPAKRKAVEWEYPSDESL